MREQSGPFSPIKYSRVCAPRHETDDLFNKAYGCLASAKQDLMGGMVKLKLISGCLAIALMQIAPSNAQSVSPAGHYSYNRRGQLGEMRVQKVGSEWRIFVIAAGAPRGAATAADCG